MRRFELFDDVDLFGSHNMYGRYTYIYSGSVETKNRYYLSQMELDNIYVNMHIFSQIFEDSTHRYH